MEIGRISIYNGGFDTRALRRGHLRSWLQVVRDGREWMILIISV